MKRLSGLLVVAMLIATVAFVPGCKKQMVTVETGEIVICTYGEIVSDTTESIEIPATEVAEHGVTTEVVTCDFHTKLAALYAEALDAIAAGDLEAAERALAEIASSDPAFRDTGSLLSEVRAKTGTSDSAAAGDAAAGGQTPGSGSQTPGGGSQTPGGGSGDEGSGTPIGPIANLMGYIPDRLPGFVGQRIYSDPFNLFRDYKPESAGEIIQLAIEVEQHQDAAMVSRRIDERYKTQYPQSGQNVKVGSLDAYFGTRPGYAILAIGDGAILVVTEFATTSGNPAAHKDALLNVAKASTGQ